MELFGFVWFFSFLACAVIGKMKGNLFGAMFLGLLFGPLALLIVTLSGNKNKKSCKFCAMGIPVKATTCPFCRKEQYII